MPHRRGDEPTLEYDNINLAGVCPTGVGMNRLRHPDPLFHDRMPHRRGDEPSNIARAAFGYSYAPQAWG